jgi:CheY-like chemotaxis protein
VGPLAASAILIDAGTRTEPDLSMRPTGDRPSIVLVTPTARANLAAFKAMGFSGYLVKPVRQSSLLDQLRARLLAAAQEDMIFSGDEALAFMPADPPVARGQGLDIILAEDNAVNALLTREMLRRRGHRVVEVTTGDAAVEMLKERCFDLLLTDIHMPGMDGIEAARAIRDNEFRLDRPKTRIVALTADIFDVGRRACQDAGMDGFLTKPVDPTELDEMFSQLFPDDGDASRTAAA